MGKFYSQNIIHYFWSQLFPNFCFQQDFAWKALWSDYIFLIISHFALIIQKLTDLFLFEED